jgi:DNA-binding beta-propeller fold protein YncE
MNMSKNGNTTSRRTFIKAAGAAALVASAPMIIADDKPAEKNPVVGEGEYKYECIHGWAKVPEGMRFGNTHMVQEDAQGRIFIHHTGAPDSVFIFDPDGKFIKSWGKEWCPGAHGMQMRKEGNEEFLYLATTGQHKVVKTNLYGEQVFVLEYPKDAKNAKGEPCYKDTETQKNGKTVKTAAQDRYNPTNIAFAPNGDFYVADGYGSNYIHQYNIKGEYIRTWGGGGNKDGQLSCPHGIFTDTRDTANPRILVADRSNERLQYFTLNGEHIATIKPAGEPNPYRHPCHFDQRGDVLVCPGLHGRVSILDKDNKVLVVLGDNTDAKTRGNNGAKPEQRKPGVFCAPHGSSFDRAGNIYVTEWVSDGRVIKLRHVA